MSRRLRHNEMTSGDGAAAVVEGEEEQILATIDASIQHQDDYEEHVIQQATQQLAPTLTGISFPPLHTLAPSSSYNNAAVAAAAASTSASQQDLPHFYAMLSQTRRDIQKKLQQEESNNDDQAVAAGNSTNSALDRLYLQEQMILCFLKNVGCIPDEDLPIRSLQEERVNEEKRSQQLQLRLQKQQQPNEEVAVVNEGGRPASGDTKPPASGEKVDRRRSSNSNNNIKKAARHHRVPMMKRKREEEFCENDEKEDEDFVQQKEQLRQLREERRRRKDQRRKAFLNKYGNSSSSSSSSEEEEMDFDDDENDSSPESQTLHQSQHDNNNGNREAATATVGASEEEVTSTSTSTTSCPLCQETIAAPDLVHLDVALSRHMDECQRRRRPSSRRGRSTRSNGHLPSVAADESMPPPPAAGKRRKTSAAKKKKKKKSKGKFAAKGPSSSSSLRAIDDMDELNYEDRVDDWIDNGLSKMKEMKERSDDDVRPGEQMLSNELYIPAWVNDRLFSYQRCALKWLWNLHQQDAGGVLGDEMGLGKTVQVAAYLGILAASRKLKSVLIIAPATMLQHWLNELAVWAPGIRRITIHQSAVREQDCCSRAISSELLRSLSRWLQRARADRLYEAIDDQDWTSMEPHSFCGTAYAVITTYENVRRNADIYTQHSWSCAVLDEAQKIRNPDADVTLACKRLPTCHRIAMSGTPVQNDLRELWSLFDFVFPGRLGTLPAFEQEFADPIKRGGYSNVTPMQVQLAYRCALTLKDLIEPYLLRRRKKDVKDFARMPGKTEHVLFCRLSDTQRSMYSAYLQSDSVVRVLRRSGQLLAAVCMLRKICNHPDLVCDPNDQTSYESFVKNGNINSAETENTDVGLSDLDDDDAFGGGVSDDKLVERSGKLEVLSKILPLWHKQGHRVLVFCQWRKMLDIIQRFMMIKGWKFCRLDGNTNIASRQRLVDSFNTDDSYFCMLCTTRTGGVGLNLTGADRIVLYDPDFNPQTDAQARERAWRFGQEREVTVYRLITAGTVEEKIYQRQIFKTALSNTVLQDPRQRRLFSQRDLRDLFSLKADTGSVRSGGDGITETTEATRGVGVVGPDEEEDAGEDESSNKDNEETLRKVMRSKGLAGVFDHNYIEQDSKRKSLTVREMEEQAKRVAREAVSALRQSVSEQHNPFEPESRFGSSKGSSGAAYGGDSLSQSVMGSHHSQQSTGSRSLLASISQRNTAVESGGACSPPSEESQHYAKLLGRISDYVRRRKPTTDELLQAFDSDIPNSEVAAIFRRLLKSVASIDKGRWHLQ